MTNNGIKLGENTLFQASTQLNFFEGFLILFLSLCAGLYVRYLYNKFSQTFSSKLAFGNTLLIVTISVTSLIAVVKTSLALSLGLVGALSVIRFRTAIKEPYNLSVLLYAICLAIAIGATQFIFALLISLFGFLAMAYTYKTSKINNNNKSSKSYVDDIDTVAFNLPCGSDLKKIYNILSDYTAYFSIVSLDQQDKESISMVIRIKLLSPNDLSNFKDLIFKQFPGTCFSFYNTPEL